MSFSRPSGRTPDAMRAVSLTRNVSKHAEGSCLVKFGDTHVLCTASGGGAEPGPAGLPPLCRGDIGAAERDKGPEEGAEHDPGDQLD